MGSAKGNLHVPLPRELHEELRAESRKSGQPATELAREGIRILLDLRRREGIHSEIAAYAQTVSGTRADLDEDLEAAGIEHLIESEER
jgi:hypothetical protein